MIVIGGHMRLKIAKQLGLNIVPVVFVDLDEGQEKELNLRLNKNNAEWDYDLLANFDPSMLTDAGWGNDELEEIFDLNMIELAPPKKNNELNLGDKKIEIKPVLYIEQISIFEKAIQKTGLQNRGEAFIKICEAYLDGN